jgi:hypothetical protein
MSIIEFHGYRCLERPLSEWQRYVCKHLRKVVSEPGHSGSSTLVKILQDGSKSSEIFLFVKGPLPSVQEAVGSPVKGNGSVITCNSCWINVYGAEEL